MSEEMRIAETEIHTEITLPGTNIRHTGIANGKSMMRHWARCHGQSFTALDNLQQSHTDGTDVNRNNPINSAHFIDNHTSKGLTTSNTAV